MRLAVYMRVSTAKQTVDSQKAELEQWVAANKPEPCEWYIDEDESSEKVSRPAWDRLMADIRLRRYDGLLVFKLDRIGRWSVQEYVRWRLEMYNASCRVISICEGERGFDSITDILIEIIAAEARRVFMQDMRDRQAASWLRAKNNPTPKMRRFLERTSKLNEEKAKQLRERYRKGESVAKLARESRCSRRLMRRWLLRGMDQWEFDAIRDKILKENGPACVRVRLAKKKPLVVNAGMEAILARTEQEPRDGHDDPGAATQEDS